MGLLPNRWSDTLRRFSRFSKEKEPFPKKGDVELLATLWPDVNTFPHFDRFSRDKRLAGVRLNTAAITTEEMVRDLQKIPSTAIPMWIDVKGRQLRIESVDTTNRKNLDMTINHPIQVQLPVPVLFKGEMDHALLVRLEEGGRRLIFSGGPRYMVHPGDSLHIRHPSLRCFGNQFTDTELSKIQIAKAKGISKYFLSFVQCQNDVEEFLDLVGRTSEVFLKIEDPAGLRYVAEEYKPRENTHLVAARGDLYVEIEYPHQILDALKLIIDKDPSACVASRLLLSVEASPIPSCADFIELAWLYDIGYRTMMLCDELCLHEEMLSTAINVFESFRNSYIRR